MAIPAEAADTVDEAGAALAGRSALLLLNGAAEDVDFALPEPSPADPPGAWRQRLSSLCGVDGCSEGDDSAAGPSFAVGKRYPLQAHSLVVFEWEATGRRGDER